MNWIVHLAWIALAAEAPPPPGAADALTLRDGAVVLGQVVEGEHRGPLPVLVRRDWAAKHVPARLAAWEKAEAPVVRRAEAQRRVRLDAWRRDRAIDPRPGDPIAAWIDAELAELDRPDRPRSPLIVANLSRADFKSIARRTKAQGRMLRLGWTLDLPEPESMPLDALARAVEDRGFAPGVETPVSVEGLLPAPQETDNRWLLRRAATELVRDGGGGRLIRFQGMILDEPAPGEAPPPAAALSGAVAAIQGMLSDTPPPDPLPAKLRELAAKGRVGAIVTGMEMAADVSGVAVESTLWVRVGADRWLPAVARSSNSRPAAMAADAGAPLAEDPQVKAAFGAIESLGFGQIPDDLKRRSLSMGAATKKALGEARSSMQAELDALALPLDPPRPREAR